MALNIPLARDTLQFRVRRIQPMASLYQRWMYAWETRLTTRDNNRVVRPLDWGLDWAKRWPLVNGDCPTSETAPDACERYLHELNDRLVAHSDEFFAYETPTDFRLERRKIELFATGSNAAEKLPKGEGEFLRFTSPSPTPYPQHDLLTHRSSPPEDKRPAVPWLRWKPNH